MPNDAKLGLVLGVGIVLAVAVIFFRKDPGPPLAVSGDTPSAIVKDSKGLNPPSPRNVIQDGTVKPTAQTKPTPHSFPDQDHAALPGMAGQSDGDTERSH